MHQIAVWRSGITPFHEQGDRVVERERWHWAITSPGTPKRSRLVARILHGRTELEQVLGDPRRRLDEMLAVVQHDQGAPATDKVDDASQVALRIDADRKAQRGLRSWKRLRRDQ